MVRSTWWADWPFSRANENLTILDVIASGTVDFKLTGLFWLLMEHRASVLVAAGPIFAGKTTLLNVLLDLLPPGVQRITLRGYAEDFSFTQDIGPEKAYLVSEEISNHQYEYLWGHQVTKTLELIPKGYAFGSTIHARDVREVAYVLHRILQVPLSLIAGLDVIVTLQAMNGRSFYDEPVRRVDTVSILDLGKDGLVAQTLAARQVSDKEFIYASEKALYNAVSRKIKIKYERLFSELTKREKYLTELAAKGLSTRQQIRHAILEYYRSNVN